MLAASPMDTKHVHLCPLSRAPWLWMSPDLQKQLRQKKLLRSHLAIARFPSLLQFPTCGMGIRAAGASQVTMNSSSNRHVKETPG